MNSPDQPETDRNITAFFDSRERAKEAIEALASGGVRRDRMLLRAGAARRPAPVGNDKSLLEEVKNLVLPSDIPPAGGETMRHEGFLLTIRPDAEVHDPIIATLKDAGALNVESRTDIWPSWKSDPEPERAGGTEHEESV